MIPSLYFEFQNTCAVRFASNTVDVDIATHPGCYLDGHAGDDTDNLEHDLNNDFAAKMSSSSLCGRSMGATRKAWKMQMDF